MVCTFSCFCVEDISLQCVPVPLAGSSGEMSLFMSSFLLCLSVVVFFL